MDRTALSAVAHSIAFTITFNIIFSVLTIGLAAWPRVLEDYGPGPARPVLSRDLPCLVKILWKGDPCTRTPAAAAQHPGRSFY